MSNTKKIPMLLKILFILLFLVSISLNIALKNNLAKSNEAINKMYTSLNECVIDGIKTNIEFQKKISQKT